MYVCMHVGVWVCGCCVNTYLLHMYICVHICTQESENGLKLGTIVKKSKKDGVPLIHTMESAKQFHKVVLL